MSEGPLAALQPLIGLWHTTIEMTDEAGAVTTHRATDRYRRALSDQVILHDVAGTMAGQTLETLEIIWPGSHGGYACRSYDNTGEVSDYTARLSERRWAIRSKALKFDGEFSADGRTLAGVWKQKRDGKWHKWLAITLRKQAKGTAAGQAAGTARANAA